MPSIYVASLADYNCGELHGEWFEIDDTTTVDDLREQIEAMLAESPSVAEGETDVAEEFAIHDCDGFYSYNLHEYASLDEVIAVAAAIEKHGEAITAWLEISPYDDINEAIAAFPDAFMGAVVDLHAWAWESFEELEPELFKATDESAWVRFDPDAYVREHEYRGWAFERLSDRTVAIFVQD
jgi:antirestriction protein